MVKTLRKGKFSDLLEVTSCDESDVMRENYSLKKIYLISDKAVQCALREHRCLKLIATLKFKASFLTTLFYSTFQNGSPMLFLTRGSGLNISHLIECRHCLCEAEAKFYISELISGLEQLRSLGIVHLGIQPGNIHLTNSGHIKIANFDRAYDLTLNKERPKPSDFRGSRGFMAPEIRSRRRISFAADIFSMGVTMMTLLLGYTPNYEKADRLNPAKLMWGIDFERHFSLSMVDFLKACLALDPDDRLSLDDIKRLELFSDTNWCIEELLRRIPPYSPSDIRIQLESNESSSHTSDDQTKSTCSQRMSDESDDLLITINLRSRRNVSMPISGVDLIKDDNSGDAGVFLRRHFNFVNRWAILNSADDRK